MKNNIFKQTIFTFTELGANLDSNHIIFTVEKLVNDFMERFEYLFHYSLNTCSTTHKQLEGQKNTNRANCLDFTS